MKKKKKIVHNITQKVESYIKGIHIHEFMNVHVQIDGRAKDG